MSQRHVTNRLVVYECIGFGLLILLSWLNELALLPTALFGVPGRSNPHEALMETGAIILAAVPTVVLTRRLGRRLVYLEKLLRVCAWCRQVHVNGRWMPIEELFHQEFKADTTHGICPSCAAKVFPHASDPHG